MPIAVPRISSTTMVTDRLYTTDDHLARPPRMPGLALRRVRPPAGQVSSAHSASRTHQRETSASCRVSRTPEHRRISPLPTLSGRPGHAVTRARLVRQAGMTEVGRAVCPGRQVAGSVRRVQRPGRIEHDGRSFEVRDRPERLAAGRARIAVASRSASPRLARCRGRGRAGRDGHPSRATFIAGRPPAPGWSRQGRAMAATTQACREQGRVRAAEQGRPGASASHLAPPTATASPGCSR